MKPKLTLRDLFGLVLGTPLVVLHFAGNNVAICLVTAVAFIAALTAIFLYGPSGPPVIDDSEAFRRLFGRELFGREKAKSVDPCDAE